jgi:hypothetical protein
LLIITIATGAIFTVGNWQSRPLLWICAAVAAASAVGVVLTFVPVLRLFGWRPTPGLPRLHVEFNRADMTETLTFVVRQEQITELIIEPLTPASDARIFMDPPVVRFLGPDQPVRCSILVEEGTGQRSTLTGLRHLLENKRSGKIQVVLRFTDAHGTRKHVPFTVEIMGTRHEVVWVPGREENASPDW